MKLRQCGNEVGEAVVKHAYVWRVVLTQCDTQNCTVFLRATKLCF